jgi:ABC-2 type transport system permease protein
VSAVPTLVRADLRSLRNRLRRMDSRRLAVLAIALPILAPAVLAPAVAIGVAMAHLGPASANGALTLGFTTLGMVMLAIGLSSVMVAFFASRDLLLLAGAPIPLADIYIARLLVAARASALVATLLLAAATGYGIAAGAGIGYWIAAPLMVLCVVLSVTAVQVALLSAVVRLVPVARARTMVSVVAALLGSGFWMAWLLLRTQQGPGVGGSLAQTAVSASSLGERLVWLPTAWPARALAGFATGDRAAPLWLVTSVLTTGALILAGHAAFTGAFRRGLSALGEVPRRSQRARDAAPAATTTARPPVLALVRKEWLVMRRDPRRLAALIPMCIIAAVYPLVGAAPPADPADFWGGVLRGGSISLMLPFFFTQILAAPAIALEGRAFMLMRLAPLDVATVLRAKVIAVAAPKAAATAVACIVLGLSRGGGAVQILALLLMGLWLALGATAIGVSGGAIGARFDAEDPRRAVSTGAALGSTVASLSFLGCSIVAALQVARATGIVPVTAVTGGDAGVAMTGGFVAVAIAVGVVMLMLTVAERRLAQWQPDGSRAAVVAPPTDWSAQPHAWH